MKKNIRRFNKICNCEEYFVKNPDKEFTCRLLSKLLIKSETTIARRLRKLLNNNVITRRYLSSNNIERVLYKLRE